MTRLPPGFWSDIFGNRDPVEIEIGPGMGAFLLSIARTQPRTNYFAIERNWRRFRWLDAELKHNPLANARVIRGDAAWIVRHLLPDVSVAAYHIYFPDPWWKRKHHARRYMTADFATEMARTLPAGTPVYFATDVDEVNRRTHQVLLSTPYFAADDTRESPRFVTTNFEMKGLARGHAIHRRVFVRNQAPVAATLQSADACA